MAAFTDATKRAITANVDLKMAVSLYNDQEKNMKTHGSHGSSNSYDDKFDSPCGVVVILPWEPEDVVLRGYRSRQGEIVP